MNRDDDRKLSRRKFVYSLAGLGAGAAISCESGFIRGISGEKGSVMRKLNMRIVGADSNDLDEYDRMARFVKRAGFEVMSCGCLSELTLEQRYDPEDGWLKYVILNAALMKVVETSLVNGVLSREHIEKNAALIAEKSKILARHGLKGVTNFLEPLILPEAFYEKHPEIRGARCDNPCLARRAYYGPCLDRPEVLAHYREGVRKLLELAPELAGISMFTNDSGAGICWCTGLYPGQNGPDYCRDVAMGTRIRKWLQAILDGATDAGKEIEIFFSPTHFGRDEIYDTIEKLPKGTHLVFGMSRFPSQPFISRDTQDYIEKSNLAGRGSVLSINPTLVSYMLSPIAEAPLPYFVLDVLREAAGSGAEGIMIDGIRAPIDGLETPSTMAILAGLSQTPRTGTEIDRAVLKIARDQVGDRLAPVLTSAWRDLDRALCLWPNIADTNHKLFPFYSIMGDRWLTRPIVPAPQLLRDDEREYYSKGRQQQPNIKARDSFFYAEGTKNYKIPEFKWLVAIYDQMMKCMNRAVADLEGAMESLEREDESTRKNFMRQYRRVATVCAIWRTQRNVLRAGSIIEFFTGEKQEEYWNVIRKDESYLLPATYRRLFLEAMDDEIENCREIIRLMRESEVVLINTGDVDEAFVLPHYLTEQLERKIEVMEAHKGDIEVLFPNCPEETFTDPTYEWADRNKDQEKADREKDRVKMGIRLRR